MLKEGQQVKKGMQIAEVGNFPENGNWVPHLHFQVISDMLGYKDDFPGVANPDQREVWLSLCPDPNLILGIEDPDLQVQELLPQDILHKRQELLGPNLSVSYKKPLKIVRGWKQYLFDHEARKYLDTVNNIAHVGHEHPFVVHAGQRQMGILNTNTRYLHENVIRFSEQLLSTMPSQLEVVYFVNSGSEANELALRMSRWYTGTQETLVLDQGYHGNTQACIDVSSYKFDGPGGQGAGQGIHKLDVPDPLSPKSTGMAIDSIINQARDLIEGIQDEGTLRLNFIHETILSCAGQIVPPMNYFKSIYEIIRKTGGVCIADEVQTGLGRVGEKFWAFELFDIVPDIVTIGKPLGNGHPVAAVVTTREIADSFNNGMEFFSSFGGNPVSCAVGMAVLQVVKEEQLQHHALTVGNYLKRNLESLKKEFPIIGDVRGFGLFTGFELIKNHTQESRMVPATKETAYLINRMRQHKILMSSDGPHHNVIKIKPPMCIMKTDMDQITEILRKVLQEDLLMHVF
jgi:4-aminobutyrate aminotransferase-like enzyme